MNLRPLFLNLQFESHHPDDAISQNYLTIQDPLGDDIKGAVFSGGFYNKRFRVKVDSDAPAEIVNQK